MIWVAKPQGKLYGFARIGRIWIFSIILGYLLYGLSSGNQERAASLRPTGLLPNSQDLKGWQPVRPPDVYTGEELFNYIDGGAELYLEFNFKQVAIQEYHNNVGSSLMIEVYEMDSPKNAYGIYSLDTRGEHPTIGQEATYGVGLLKFWKDRFFCRILSLDLGKAMKKEVILSVGEKIAAKIPSEGARPQILDYIPRENTVPESIHYFHQRVALNNFYYLSNKNILNLTEETEGVFFEYQLQEKPAKVILIKYPREKDSLVAFKKFLNLYFEDKGINDSRFTEGKEIIKPMQDGQYAGIKLYRAYLILALETKDKKNCQGLLASIAKGLR